MTAAPQKEGATTTVGNNAAPDQLVGDEHIEWPISEEMDARLWQMHEAVMEHLPHHCETFVAVPFIPVPGETYTPELRALLEALTVELDPWLRSLGSTEEVPAVYFNLGGMTLMAHGWDFYLEPEQPAA